MGWSYTINGEIRSYTINGDTSTLHLPLAHISSPIFETIHVSILITTIKKNKIVSLLFNVGLNIFINSPSSILTPTFYIYVVI